MKTSLPIANINGSVTRGQAHIQPGANKWIGVCIVPDDFFEEDAEELTSVTIEYEGPFNFRKYQTTGKAKAKILSVSKAEPEDQLIITFEGIEEPILKRKLQQELKFSYNENLPVYVNKQVREKAF